MSANPIPVFDGHNDTILSLERTGRSFFDRSDEGHVDLPRAQEGHLAGGFFAIYTQDPKIEIDPDLAFNRYQDESTMPGIIPTDYAQASALHTFGALLKIEAASGGKVKVVRTVQELRDCIASGTFAMELHIEGAEPIDANLDALEVFYAAGLRSIGLVWSRPNIFGRGVPFKFPSSPDTGDGLTEPGKNLVRAANRLGMVLDVSHLNEKGFWDLAAITDDPIVATHSGVHAICPSSRNLTDKQLDAIKDSDGIVGVNYHVGFLNPSGSNSADDTTVATLADHVDYLVNRIGIDRVALGSDFDGATMSSDLKDASGVQKIVQEIRRRGYDEASLRKIGYENWIRIFERTWQA